jgi:type II secretory pathway component GspD/PulD (secretin)
MKSVLPSLLLAAASAAFGAPPEKAVAPTAAVPAAIAPEAAASSARGRVTLNLRDTPLHEVFDLLSRHERVNIVLGKGVTGTVSVNLYNVEVKAAIRTIAEAAGYALEVRGSDFLIIERKDADLDAGRDATRVRTFKVQYTNPKQVAEILGKYLSRFGKITPLAERNLLVVEDLPGHMERVQRLLAEIDVEPRQIMIEAKILEITLDRSETFGIDWSGVFGSGGRSSIGTTGLAPRNTAGLFFNIVNSNLEIFLSALSSKGRVNTLSTPKLLALENEEASAVIGDRIGYKVTTTINQVTTESIQFLETGVILRVTPSVDQQGRIMLKIHPEVSSASVAGGIPSKKSTEVTTQLLCNDGESIFIGGLIKSISGMRRTGVPVLGDLPVVGRLLSNSEETGTTTETIVVITPRIIARPSDTLDAARVDDIESVRRAALRAAAPPAPRAATEFEP